MRQTSTSDHMEKKTEKAAAARWLFQRGVALLEEELHYSQRVIVDKMDMLHCPLSTATMHNMVRDKPVGASTLAKAAKAMRELVQKELGLEYDDKTGQFRPVSNAKWKREIVPERAQAQVGIKVHPHGRMSLAQKTQFIADAVEEVVEVGVRLNTFANYFHGQNEQAYKAHIVRLLRNGVNIRGYLLDPECKEAWHYFEDRAKALPSEKDAIGEAKKVVERLQILSKELADLGLQGKFEIYKYRHLPSCLYHVVDPRLETGKMLFSPYLYGIRRANCPVIELTKKEQPAMFRTYLDSLTAITKHAERI